MTNTNVIFRTEKSGPFKGEVTAVLTDEGQPTFNHSGTTDCYAELGQHSICHVDWYLTRTRAAKPEEYASLKKELEDIGYNLIVKSKRSL